MGPIGTAGNLEVALQRQLARRELQGRLRYLGVPRPGLVDFSSNDYLSLSRDVVVRDALIAHLSDLDRRASPSSPNGRAIGSGGSRLLDGNSAFAENLERKISEFHGSEAALLFTSAYDANVGLMSCVPETEDVILYDGLIHASIHDGMRLSRATRKIPFAHGSIVRSGERRSIDLERKSMHSMATNQLHGLESTLKQLICSDRRVGSGTLNVFVCVEALYSMDGDIADLQYVSDVVKALLPKGNGYIIVDEAHSIGVLGACGRGLVCELGLEDRVWARVVGFGKAMGCAGGAVLCSPVVRMYLINYARTLIYTTAMSFPSLGSISAAYDYMITEKAEKRRLKLGTLIQHCYARLRDIDQRSKPTCDVFYIPGNPSSSPIIPLITKYPKNLAQYCQASGFMIRPIVAPTVPRGQERIRICLHATNEIEQVDGLCHTIETWLGTEKGIDMERNQTGVMRSAYIQEVVAKVMKPNL